MKNKKKVNLVPNLKKHFTASSFSNTCRMNHRSGSLKLGVCDKYISNGSISNSRLEASFASEAKT